MSSHQSSRAKSIEWFTPPEIIGELGPFDLDPCTSSLRPWPTAIHHYTAANDGMLLPWRGRVWLNPPYGMAAWPWLARLSDHGDGIALIFARTETAGFHEWVWPCAAGLLFLEGRLYFRRPDGTQAKGNAGAPSVLVAYGDANAEILKNCNIAGHYVKLDNSGLDTNAIPY